MLYKLNKISNNKVFDNIKQKLSRPDSEKKEADVIIKGPLENVYSMEEAIEHAGFGLFQIKLILLTGFAYVANAIQIMIVVVLAPALSCDWLINDFEKSMINAIVFVGTILSGYFWGWLCDKYGRNKGLLLSSIITFYFAAMSTFSPTLIWVLITRCMVGFGSSGVFQSFTILTEFSPKSKRAIMSVAFSFFWPVGVVLLVGLAIPVMPTLGWRYFLGISAIPILISAISMFWMPESPRYYLASGQTEMAKQIIVKVARENNNDIGQFRLKTLENVKQGRLSDLFKRSQIVTTLVLWCIWFLNMILYYGIVMTTTELFKFDNACEASAHTGKANEATCDMVCMKTSDYMDLFYTTIAEIPGLILAVVCVDLIGRKWSISIFYIGIGLSILLLNMCVSRSTVVAILFIARALLSSGWQSLVSYTTEAFPTSIRGLGVGSCSSVGKIGGIITSFLSYVLFKASPHFALSLFGSLGIFAGLLALFLTETKGKELKEQAS